MWIRNIRFKDNDFIENGLFSFFERVLEKENINDEFFELVLYFRELVF